MPWGRHRGVPISHNALQHYPECHGADTEGYPYPIMLCNITQNAMGQIPRGVPSQVQLGGVPCQIRMGVPCWGVGTQVGRVLPSRIPPGRVPPGRVPWARSGQGYPGRVPPSRVPPGKDGGYPCRVPPCQGNPPGRVPPGRVPPSRVSPWARSGCRGGTQLGQQKEYSLHGGRYASCVHAGGLSCW